MLNYIPDDRTLVTYVFPYMWLINAVLVVFLEIALNFKATYGRYNTSNSGISARLAWFIQELPSFVVPCYLLYYHQSSLSTVNVVIVGLFLIHYFQRYVTFLFYIKGYKLVHEAFLFYGYHMNL